MSSHGTNPLKLFGRCRKPQLKRFRFWNTVRLLSHYTVSRCDRSRYSTIDPPTLPITPWDLLMMGRPATTGALPLSFPTLRSDGREHCRLGNFHRAERNTSTHLCVCLAPHRGWYPKAESTQSNSVRWTLLPIEKKIGKGFYAGLQTMIVRTMEAEYANCGFAVS